MSDKYKKTSAYECEICGDLHDHPSLAEKCYTQCYLYRLFEEIAELRIRGGQTEADHEHTKLEMAAMIEDLEEARDALEAEYGDDCNHGEYMKHIQTEGGIYCADCGEQVNDYPEDPETFTL